MTFAQEQQFLSARVHEEFKRMHAAIAKAVKAEDFALAQAIHGELANLHALAKRSGSTDELWAALGGRQ